MNEAKLVEAIGEDSHVAVFYDDAARYWKLLATYYRTGLERNELGVLVTQTSPKDAVDRLRAAGFNDIEKYVIQGQLRIFDMVSTYLPNGQFVADYMLSNVINFIEDAREQGYSGIRTAGEMNWLADWGKFQPEAEIYEGRVNDIDSGRIHFTGLCLYAAQETDLATIKSAAHTHATYIYNDAMHSDGEKLLRAIREHTAGTSAQT